MLKGYLSSSPFSYIDHLQFLLVCTYLAEQTPLHIKLPDTLYSYFTMRLHFARNAAIAFGAIMLLAPVGNLAIPTGISSLSSRAVAYSLVSLIRAVREYLEDSNAYVSFSFLLII